MKYLFINFCIFLWIVQVKIGYAIGTDIKTHFAFMFCHVGFIHLAMNMFVFYQLYDVLHKKLGLFLLPSCVIISFVSSFLCEYSIPTMGASGIIFSMIGMVFAFYKFEKKAYITNSIMFALSFIIGYFTHQNILLHFVCMVAGFIIGLIIKNNGQRKNNIERIA